MYQVCDALPPDLRQAVEGRYGIHHISKIKNPRVNIVLDRDRAAALNVNWSNVASVLYDAFGPRRCHWGSDVTNSYAKATYRQRVTHFTEELAFLSEDDKDWIMGKSIVERLRWT